MLKNLIFIMCALAVTTSSYAGDMITKEEAESALRETLTKTPGCIVNDAFKSFPITIDPDSLADNKTRSILKALTDAGVMKVEKKAVKMKKNMGFMTQQVTVNAELYSLTEAGKKDFRDDAVQISRGRNKPVVGPGLCYATNLKVSGIKRFQGPTIINYYLLAENKSEWANNEKVIRTGLIIDKSWGNFKTFTLAGQEPPPPGIEATANFRKQKDGSYQLTHY